MRRWHKEEDGKILKLLAFLVWITKIAHIVVSIFVNLYVFSISGSLIDLLIYYFWMFLGYFTGGSLVGGVFPKLKKDIKLLYMTSFVLFMIAFWVLLVMQHSGTSFFGLLYGMATGMFWVANHTQEVRLIGDKKRDEYTAVVGGGITILEIAVPFVMGVLFALASRRNLDPYLVAFFVLPLIFGRGLMLVKKLPRFVPDELRFATLKKFLRLRQSKFAIGFFVFTGLWMALLMVILPVLALLFLKSEMNVGFFQSFVKLLAAVVLVRIARPRNMNARLKWLRDVIFGGAAVLLIFGLFFNLPGYVWFALMLGVVMPFLGSFGHLFTLSFVNEVFGKENYYLAVVFREGMLLVGRLLALGVLLLLWQSLKDLEVVLRVAVFVTAVVLLLRWWTAQKFWERR